MKSTRPAYRLLSLLLALVMVLGMLPAPHASAVGEVTYTKVSKPESGKIYVIVAEGDNSQQYALTITTHDGYTNQSSYTYSGFEGKPVTVIGETITGEFSSNMYWKFTSKGNGFTIQNLQEEMFLGSYYTKSNPMGGKIFLTDEDNADTWTIESGSKLKGSISGKQLTYDSPKDHVNKDKITSGSADLFTVRTEGDNISFYEVKGYTPETSVAVTGVTVDPTSGTLEIGEDLTLTATVAPTNASNKTVTWKSSDEDVATVENGVVTAVGAGEATITVTTVDGNKTAECDITVNAVVVPTTTYQLATSVGAGGQYLIVSNGYALTNNNGTNGALKVEVSADKQTVTIPTSDVSDSIKWTLYTYTGEYAGGNYEIRNSNYYLQRQSAGSGSSARDIHLVTSSGLKTKEDPKNAYYLWTYDVENKNLTNAGGTSSKPETFYLYYNTSASEFYTYKDRRQGDVYLYVIKAPATLTGIEVTKQPTKTTYEVGDDFDTDGMVVTARYSDNSTKPVTGYTVTNGNNLTASQTQVEITYSEGGETKVTYVPITVKEKIQESSDIHLAFTSDIHNGGRNGNDNTAAERLDTWLTNVGKKIGDTFETMAFAGDNGSASLNGDTFWTAVQNVMDVVSSSDYVKDDGFFVNGNHEFQNGSQGNTSNATAGKIKNIGAKIVTDNYVIYGFGAASGSQSFNYSEASASDISRLDDYLKTVPTTTPVFVISHFPIHYCSGQIGNRTSANADKLVKVLNNYPNVIFLWGHNHTESDPLYDEVFKSGKELQLTSSSSSKVTINFTYAAAGCMSDSDYTSGSGSVKGKGLVAKVEGNKVTLTYYDANGNKVGTSTEITITAPHKCENGTIVKGQAATCGADGWKDHYKCSCGKTYEDQACTKLIDNVETWQKNGGKISATGKHSTSASGDKAATCEEKAYCSVCKQFYGEPNGHAYGTLIAAKEAVHTPEKLEPAIAAHYICAECDTYFTEAKVATTLDELTETTPTHSYSTTAWAKDASGHWRACACGSKQENTFAQHSYTNDRDTDCNTCGYNRTVHICEGNLKQGQPATCTVDGWKNYYECSCEKLYEDEACTREIENFETWKTGDGKIAAAHTYGTLIPAQAEVHTPTTLTASVDAHYFCDVCDTYFTEAKVATTLEKLTGTAPTHSYATTWKSDEDGHWHECACGAKSDEANHIPGAAATEDTAQTCTKCEYVITPALGHIHTKHLTEVPAQPATCTKPGNILYYTCDCGRWFSDEDATTEITDKESVKTAPAKHTSAKVTGQAATCTVDGWKDYYECSVCHAPFIDEALTNPIADLAAWKVGGGKIAAAHTYGNLIPEVPTVHTQTELKAGTKAHYKCAVCSKFFDTEKKEVTEASLTIAAPEHNYSLAYAKNETQHWHECACGAKFRVENHTSGGPATETESEICTVCEYVINAPAGHIHTNHLTLVAGKDATCTEAGSVQHYSCSCGKLFLDANATQETTNTVLPAKGHTEVIQNAVEPTCTEDGLTEGSFCNVCGTVFKAQETIAASGHTAIVEDEVEATCDKDGSTAGIYCEVCGEYLTLPEVIPALGHDWDDGEVTRKPTSTLPGIMTYTCQSCDATKTEEIPFAPAEIYRISGNSRVETALATADALKEALGIEAFDAIIIANGDNFADALAGSYLAAVKQAPILLRRNSGAGDNLNEYYIDKNLVNGGTVYILGGEAVVPKTIEDALKASDYNVVRLFGDTRIDTNLAILKEAGIKDGDDILVATGWNYADCLSASATGKPILIVNEAKNELTAAQVEFLKAHSKNQYTIIGGTAAISQTLEDAIDAIVEKGIVRIYGETRESTSVKVAQHYFKAPTFALIAYSRNFPDGLTAGPLAYALGAPLLLTSTGQEAVTAEYIGSNDINSGYVMGGPAAISDSSARACFGITSAATIPAK